MRLLPVSVRYGVVALGLTLTAAAVSIPAFAAQNEIRVGMVPDAGATQVSIEEKAPLKDYLARAMGEPVVLVVPTNYNATVEALGNGSLDFAYLGGLTYIKAHKRYGVVPLVQRESDRQFHSLFITQAGSPIHTLADLKGKQFAFGDINSTSGHLMPYEALTKAGIDPDRDMRYRYTGSHPATAKAVEAGVVDAGAMDESVYQAMIADGKLDRAKIRVFYTTPAFVDYVWVARRDIDAATRDKFGKAFLALESGRDDKILDILRGKKFVTANDHEYATLRRVASELKLF
ncbi:MAG TPA: phosphate/phosphite/phosphonate ABC transporter substrate-binding protein [Alphaproteobacteria bacterium]|nr:phosphate/phosphite/phosphonate ABC transporter substrate-binding protein [Alphaproteobacteria bacterium]